MLCYSNGTPWYSRFHKAELGLGLSWGCSVPSARLTHSDAMSVKLIHIQILSVRLTHSCAMGVKLIHIGITSVRLTHRYAQTTLEPAVL